MRTPYKHQKKGIQYLKSRAHSALLWEMRTGKSHAIIAAFNHLDRVLVVCPKPVTSVWHDELRADGIRRGDMLMVDSGGLDSVRRLPKWVVANYEAVLRFPEKWLSKFDVVVLDEAVRIKNPKAKLTKFFIKNFRSARRCIASGNLAPESPLEYFSPMQFLYGEWMGCRNFWQFRHRYFWSDPRGWAWWPKSKRTKEQIKDAVKADAYVLSRKDVGLANEKIFQQRVIEMPPKLRKLYKEMEDEFAMTLPDGQEIEVKHVIVQLNYLCQLAGGGTTKGWLADHKIDELVTLLKGELAGEQVVVWFRFNIEIAHVAERLLKEDIRFGVITGDSEKENRTQIQAWFKIGLIRVLLIQVRTGLYGLNLSEASTAIYFSHPLSSNERLQSEDRIAHPNKRGPLLYVELVSKDSVDSDLCNALKKKQNQSRYFLGQVIENMKERRQHDKT